MFTKGKWIRADISPYADMYTDFFDDFDYTGGACTLKIASDSNYTVWINGKLAAFGQYADYPYYKVGDVVDVTGFVRRGKNRICLQLWYYGHNSQTYIIGDCGIIYELTDTGGVISYSCENTLSRISPDYIGGVCHEISGQLGLSYHYDMKGFDNWYAEGAELCGFKNSVICTTISYSIRPRPVKKLVLKDRSVVKTVQQGAFIYKEPLVNSQTDMQHAYLSFRGFNYIAKGDKFLNEPAEYSLPQGENLYFIVDLGRESSGFLDFDIEVPFDCDMEVGYGEHLTDGRCRTSIRDFSVDIKLKAGRNVYMNTFRRFGCRYIQFFIHSSSAIVRYAGLRETVYPVNVKKPDTGSLLRDTIYEVCQNTLIQCMHEHYEDCPWREQALYTMDSRNQMLSGYYAFGETEFPRACLELISQGVRDDGLLSLCYPAGLDFPIPSFSLMYFVQMNEYIIHSKDTSLAESKYKMLKDLMNVFLKRIGKDGLCMNFYGKDGKGDFPYWNFYEWSETMSGAFGERNPSIEAPLNADLSIALQSMAQISEALGYTSDKEYYLSTSTALNKAICDKFYNPEAGLFRSFEDRHHNTYSVLTNSLCLLCGAADDVDKTKILEILANNGGTFDGIKIVPNTLSMNSFRFDALLRHDRDKYAPIIIDEIDRVYLYMLRHGATSFWETIESEDDFDNAGSLCHGWSALPVYYYETLLKK